MKITDEMVARAEREYWDMTEDPEGARDMRAVLSNFAAALAVQTQQGVEVKKLAFNDDPCPAAACAFGHYVINPIYSHVELLVGYGRMSMTSLGRVQLGHGASFDDLRAAAQSDYETRIRSALVDVPAVESEPVAKPDWWQDEGAAEREFTEYFVRNYPGPDTIIHDPNWHAPKLFRAAKLALLATALSTRKGSAGDGSATTTSGKEQP